MTRAAPQTTSSVRLPRGSLLWLLGLGCGAVVALATPTALLCGILLAPSLVAIMLDSAPGKPMARSVLLWGASALVQPVAALWRTSHSTDVALGLAMDTHNFAAAWAAQAAGWLISELSPLMIALALDSRSIARAALLRRTRARHEAEWGLPPADANAEARTK